ncbi:MAG: ABC transporter substrate-binding protein [Planctomycetota bacterium]|nr:ABC transporter substrate-binding protein [Planctomycetota bacterium]
MAQLPLRVASLLPSATELICAAGKAENLVGVSHECDWPSSVRDLPVLTSARVVDEGGSGRIHQQVVSALQEALSIYTINEEALAQTRPNVIVTQDLCDVCAVSYEDVSKAVQRLFDGKVELVNLHPTRLSHIFDDLLRVGRALGSEDVAQESLDGLLSRVEQVRSRVSSQPDHPRVLTLEWLDPVMIGGTWMPELVEIAGGEPLVTQAGDVAPTLDRQALADLDPGPDVVLIKPCGFTLDRTLEERDLLEEILASVRWPAVEQGRVFVADGNAYFNRSGPRIVDSLEILAGMIHPDVFPDLVAKHQGSSVVFESRR